MCKSKQNLSKFVAKLLKYRILFKDILTFGYRYMTAYNIVPCYNQMRRIIISLNFFV